jgi:hypothetical protein
MNQAKPPDSQVALYRCYTYIYLCVTGSLINSLLQTMAHSTTDHFLGPLLNRQCQLRSITSTVCHTYTFYLLMIGSWCTHNIQRCDNSINWRQTVHRVGYYSRHNICVVTLQGCQEHVLHAEILDCSPWLRHSLVHVLATLCSPLDPGQTAYWRAKVYQVQLSLMVELLLESVELAQGSGAWSVWMLMGT